MGNLQGVKGVLYVQQKVSYDVQQVVLHVQ